jgi:predicted GNAT family acetyltransferase/glutaredoxin
MMTNAIPVIKLYGAVGCHKTKYYQLLLNETELPYQFLDVENNKDYATELRGIYENGKLNFPTITIGTKKLRNPSREDLDKWLNKLIPERLPIIHDKNNKCFVLNINGELAKVEYQLRGDKIYLIHSEVPFYMRGRGIGKVLVEKTFEQLTKEKFKAVAVCSYVKAVAKRSKKWNSIIEQVD